MKETQENTIAIRELAVIAKQTSKDVDRLIKHWQEVPEARIISLEHRTLKLEDAVNKRSWWGFTTVITILGFFMYKHFFG